MYINTYMHIYIYAHKHANYIIKMTFCKCEDQASSDFDYYQSKLFIGF